MYFNVLNQIFPLPQQQDDYVPVAPVLIKPAPKALKLSVVFMQAADVDAFVDIQQRVYATLLKPYHLKERTVDDIAYHLDQRMPAIGVKAFEDDGDETGTLVGGCLLTYLSNEDGLKNLGGYPVHGIKKLSTAVVQTLCVDPVYKGNKISRTILDTAFSVAAEKRMTNIVSAIADDNAASIHVFKDAGYKPFEQGIDEKLGYKKTYYRLPLFGCNAA